MIGQRENGDHLDPPSLRYVVWVNLNVGMRATRGRDLAHGLFVQPFTSPSHQERDRLDAAMTRGVATILLPPAQGVWFNGPRTQGPVGLFETFEPEHLQFRCLTVDLMDGDDACRESTALMRSYC